MAKKVITVFGATGSQGNSVVQAFLGDDIKDEWQVRGVTRDVTKDSAKKLASQGVEVVTANMDDKESLVKAMTGATAVFAVTNYWETMSAETETKQGKNLADAAKEAGVKHYIFSSLLDVTELSKGVLPGVLHFDSKARAEEYTRSLGIPASFFLAGFYMSNLTGGMMRPQGPDNTWTLAMPVPESTPVPMFDPRADTGKFVKGMVLADDKVFGKRVLAATSYMTFGEIVETFRKTFPVDGKTATFVEVPQADFKNVLMNQQGMPDFAAEEMLQNLRLLNEFGYYGGASLDESQAILKDKLTTWEEHLKKALPDLK